MLASYQATYQAEKHGALLGDHEYPWMKIMEMYSSIVLQHRRRETERGSNYQSRVSSTIFKKRLGSSLSCAKSWLQRNFKKSDWSFRGLGTRKHWLFTENQNPGLVYCKQVQFVRFWSFLTNYDSMSESFYPIETFRLWMRRGGGWYRQLRKLHV